MNTRYASTRRLAAATIILLVQPALAMAQTNQAQPTKTSAMQSSGTLTSDTLDAVIVTVADEPLLLSELQQAIFQITNKSTKLNSLGKLTGGSLSTKDAEIILEQLINQKILSLRTRELGLNLSEDELDSEIRAFLQQQNISEDKFQDILKAEGQSVESHREEFRKQVETQRFIGRVIRPLVSVTEDQVRGFYLQQTADREKSQLVRLRSLMIDIPSGLSNDELQSKRKHIEAIRRDIDAGRPFVELVQIYSEAKNVLQNRGELPPRPLTELPEKLRERIKGKNPPLIVGPIDLGTSVFFFEYLGTELGDQKEYEKLKPQFEAKLLDIKFRERLDEYLRTERNKVKVKRRDIRFER
jgi:peptidyl-prolyl cis-trans isomerase SurA